MPPQLCGQSTQPDPHQRYASVDSILKSYSIDELLQLRDFYDKERLALDSARIMLREKGIQDMEVFLKSYTESSVLDKVMMRLAELYFEKARDDYQTAQDAYSKQLALYDAGQLAQRPEEPRVDYSRSLALYQRVIDEYPQSSLVDDARFSTAFLIEAIGNRDEAVTLYENFLEEFPESRYVPDALMRIGEYYFNPPAQDIVRAIAAYKQLLKYTDSPKYDEALYRLGWCHYKLSRYPEAIAYFTVLADDVQRAAQFDPQNQITNPSLKDESIEYIGISFLDYQGAEGAAHYLTTIGGRDYGADILRKLGDAYLNVKQEYDNAIKAYTTLLRLYPLAEEAPLVQAKIAEIHRLLGDERTAYAQRELLFQNYLASSEWWKHNQDKAALKQAVKLAQASVRDNIALLLRRADAFGDADSYAQAVNDSRKYLAAFPQDSTSAQVHWNMALMLDTKLHHSAEAYDEYLNLSRLYSNTHFQKMAAENAIAMSQESVRADTRRRDPVLPLRLVAYHDKTKADSDTLRRVLNLQEQPLSADEIKLVQALDNYIKLFPNEANTAERLAQAGALYYNRNNFSEALKYFKTLIKHFPNTPEIEYAQYLVMESYFGKGDYKSTEIVAQRIRQSGTNNEYTTKAEQRLAESIFLHAEVLADSAEHLKAAAEFCRVVHELSNVEFADLALYNAGLAYDQAHEFARAIETYARLTTNYKSSPHYLSALNNMALDFGELKDYVNAAATFERLSNEEPDPAKAEAPLFNASVFAARAADWPRAIRVNQQFVSRFPNSGDADDLFYDVASYYLKLNDTVKASTIYGEYADKFPDSPRAVETYYRQGEFFEGRGEIARAKDEYNKAIAKSNALREKKLEANDFFAAEALYRLTELKHQDFVAIRFALPKERMDQAKATKKRHLLDLVDSYTRIAAFGTTRLYESTYKIGLSYEEFAETWAQQELPPLDESQRIVAQKQINETAADLYVRAVEAYKQGLHALTRLSIASQKSSLDSVVSADSASRVAVEDTTIQVARRWIDRIREKVSEVLYEIAEINNASVDRLLQAPLPARVDKITALEFRNQLLGRFVRPLVNGIVEAHQRNLSEAAAMGLSNRWVEQSRERLMAASNLLAEQYASLGWQAFTEYDAELKVHKDLLVNGDSGALDAQEHMANFIDFGQAFSKAAVQIYGEALDRAMAANIPMAHLHATEEKLLTFATRITTGIDSLATHANTERQAVEYQLKQGARDELQEALLVYEDNYFSLKDGAEEILQNTFDVSRRHKIENELMSEIILSLVRSDPEKYAGLLNLTITPTQIVSDHDWMVSSEYAPGWTELDFSSESWHGAAVTGQSENFKAYGAQRIWLSAAVPANHDSLGAVHDSAQTASDHFSVLYFRREFSIVGLPVSGQVQLTLAGSYKLMVNGEAIAQYNDQGADGNSIHVHDFAAFLHSGRNVLALEVQPSHTARAHLEAVMFLKSLPGLQEGRGELQ